MKKSKPKVKPTNSKKKVEWKEVLITAFAIVSIIGTLAFIVYLSFTSHPPARNHRIARASPGTVLDHKKVCMASNFYMREVQIPVHILGKEYYSCSDPCSKQHQAGDSVWLAKGLYTSKLIFKCHASITMNPDSARTILYFETPERT